MTIKRAYSLVTSIVVVGFLARYIVNERRLAQVREQVQIHEARNRVIPWADWTAWREARIKEEFSC